MQGHPHLFLCLQSFSSKNIGLVGRVKKKVKENRLFSLLCASTDTYDMSLYFNVYCFSFSRKIIALYSKC